MIELVVKSSGVEQTIAGDSTITRSLTDGSVVTTAVVELAAISDQVTLTSKIK